MKFSLLALLFYYILAFPVSAQTGTTLFPQNRIYQKYYADAISHQFSLLKHFESNEWFGNIGINKPLMNLGAVDNPYQLTFAATVFSTLKITPPHVQVFTADYLVDIFLDKKIANNLIMRFNWGHLSAHYSDDGILQLNKTSINYVRDYISVQGEKLINQLHGKIYAAATFNFHNEPRKNKHFTFQVGFDAGKQINENLLLYFAFDFKAKAEVNYGTTKNFQIGIKFPTKSQSDIRIAYTYRTGYEERGQLYNQTDNKNLIGIYLDF
jgi:hypothetical protein